MNSGGSFYVFVGSLNQIELSHLRIHLISQHFLNHPLAQINFIPILLQFVFFSHGVFCHLFLFLLLDHTALVGHDLAVDHILHTVQVLLSFLVLSLDMLQHLAVHLPNFICLLLHAEVLLVND